MPPVHRLGLKSDERLTELRLDELHVEQQRANGTAA